MPVEGVNSGYDDLGPRVTADNRSSCSTPTAPAASAGTTCGPRRALEGRGRGPGGGASRSTSGRRSTASSTSTAPPPRPTGSGCSSPPTARRPRKEQKEAWRATIRGTASVDFDLWVADLDPAAPVRPATQPAALADHVRAAKTSPPRRPAPRPRRRHRRHWPHRRAGRVVRRTHTDHPRLHARPSKSPASTRPTPKGPVASRPTATSSTSPPTAPAGTASSTSTAAASRGRPVRPGREPRPRHQHAR